MALGFLKQKLNVCIFVIKENFIMILVWNLKRQKSLL